MYMHVYLCKALRANPRLGAISSLRYYYYYYYYYYNSDDEYGYIYAKIRENTGHHRTSSKAISKTRCWTYRNKANNTMNMLTCTHAHTHKYNAYKLTLTVTKPFLKPVR